MRDAGIFPIVIEIPKNQSTVQWWWKTPNIEIEYTKKSGAL